MAQAKTVIAQAMSDEAVQAKTGKNWTGWFAILDRAGASKMTHKEIVAYLDANHPIGPWWQQTVTVTYEKARGLRDDHEKTDGYQISVSRTINTPLAKLFKSFANERERTKWLDEEILIRKATPNRSMRVTWADGKSSLEINFYPRGDKSQVVVQHSKLSNANEANKMKTYWSKTLDGLRKLLEE